MTAYGKFVKIIGNKIYDENKYVPEYYSYSELGMVEASV